MGVPLPPDTDCLQVFSAGVPLTRHVQYIQAKLESLLDRRDAPTVILSIRDSVGAIGYRMLTSKNTLATLHPLLHGVTRPQSSAAYTRYCRQPDVKGDLAAIGARTRCRAISKGEPFL
jgi:hypothetical protein